MKEKLKNLLEKIKYDCLSYADCVFLQSRSGKAGIKRYFPSNALLCMAAGIKESTFIRWNKGVNI